MTYDGPRDGTKKDVSGEMPATYQPLYVEAAWQEYWEAAGFYQCDPAKAAVSGRASEIPDPCVESDRNRWRRLSISACGSGATSQLS